MNWTNTGAYLIKTRSNSFDSHLVESGPTPLRLKSGDYLFIYNSARTGHPSVKPGWQLQYNFGFTILNGSDPLQIIQRSSEPIFSPELEWEIGNVHGKYLTPNVVFLEGFLSIK